MASSEYNYDESGETWPFFILALLSFILLPLTFKYVARVLSNTNPAKENESIKGSISETSESLAVPNLREIQGFQAAQKSLKIFNKTLVVLVVGWATVFYLAKYVTKEADLTGLFDPYTILDVSFTASEREIKSHYRKLSLKYHPDKLPKDLTEEQRLAAEQAYIRLTSAYKALTDEVTRENFLRYGHPDGEQPTTHGIALPQFLVEGKYSSLVVIFYFMLIGVLLPLIVGKWWSNVKTHTRKGLHVDTAANFVRKFADRNPAKIITPEVILDYVLESQELKQEFPNLSRQELKLYVFAHFDRKTVKNEKAKLKLISKLPFLINGLIDIAVVFKLQDTVIAAENLKKSIVQAVPPTGQHQDLLQLPFVDPEVVTKQPIKKLGKLFAISKDEAKKALGITDDAKLTRALKVAEHIPSLRVIEAEVKVPGEEDGQVPPHSHAHISVRFLVKSPRLKSCPEIDDERLKDEETLEYMKNPLIVNEQQPPLPYAYAPYFPQPFRNSWSCFVISQKENRLLEDTTSYSLDNIDLSNLQLLQEEWIKGTDAVIGTFKIQLPAPTGNVGKYYYRLVMKNNAYFGADVDIPIDLEVTPVSIGKTLAGLKKKMAERQEKEAESDYESDSDSDISDPEEDSLAGAIAALRGSNTKKTKTSDGNEDDEDEEEEEEVFTDINTDTEDEGDN
ncbi:Protein translocation protein SEC63 [Candida viswanathii]|uniref:Protein translocation protein SEC63 n=1 Tax=Candida viswanathii TaxID=5486 RepID=A0A367YBQ4_9ASCO|nr:Protein translocation protein SEC63 [Candida viswanathii]